MVLVFHTVFQVFPLFNLKVGFQAQMWPNFLLFLKTLSATKKKVGKFQASRIFF